MLYIHSRSIETNQVLMDITWKYYLRENGQKHWYIECDSIPFGPFKTDEKPSSFEDDEKSIEEQLKAIL